MARFEANGGKFLYDGKPFRIFSGAVHYFRVVPGYWKDRLTKLAACGLNTVETVVPWNLHEPERGRFRFDGIADLEGFIRLAGTLGLKVILRPSPYICAEWEFGGLPAWLLGIEGMELRCANRKFLDCVRAYYDELFSRLRPLLCGNGGPVIAMQIENEYGSYGDDRAYLSFLRDAMRERAGDTLLFTSDGPVDALLDAGTLPDVLKTVNFGSDWRGAFQKLAEHEKNGPLMCMEYWNGWFDHWGGEHIERAPQDAARELGEMLEAGLSVNLYMFHGGTNFGFWNGANHQDKYEPDVTSYDYDAPLSEEGDRTEKYDLFRRKFLKYSEGKDIPPVPPDCPKADCGALPVTRRQGLFHCPALFAEPVRGTVPLSMEQLGQSFGFVLYRSVVRGPRKDCKLEIHGLHDRAQVFVNGEPRGDLYRAGVPQSLTVSFERAENTLEILVENMGRINYGVRLGERKGITDCLTLDSQKHFGWEMLSLPLDNTERIPYRGEAGPGEPAFYSAFFDTEKPADTYFDSEGWRKGAVFVNGFNLGRYWEAGPQRTLYLPAPLLKKGRNEIVVFEQYGGEHPEIRLTGKKILKRGGRSNALSE